MCAWTRTMLGNYGNSHTTGLQRCGIAVSMVAMALIAGCTPGDPQNKNEPVESAAAEKVQSPKFEFELVHTRPNGTASTNRLPSISARETRTIVDAQGQATKENSVEYQLRFKEHRNGKDVYSLELDVQEAGNLKSKTFDVEYAGKRIVVAEFADHTFVLQPLTE